MNAQAFEHRAEPQWLDTMTIEILGSDGERIKRLLNLRGGDPVAVAITCETLIGEARAPGHYGLDRQVPVQKGLQRFVHQAWPPGDELRTNTRRFGCTWQIIRPSGVRTSRRSKRPTRTM